MTMNQTARARDILAANDRGGYTVPTHGLYPFQWNWDSAFVAMGFATFDVDRALAELERLALGQWTDGMIPQIVFHQPADSYFPGPEVWGTTHRVSTSGITQPPAFALALKAIAALARASDYDRIAALMRVADRYHRWFHEARDPDATGLVTTLHNWETGRDNSPEWDAPFARVPETTTTVVRRKDTGHVDASMRPTDAEYRRYIHLVDLYRNAGWQPAEMMRISPFRVADIGTNAILLAAEEALLGLSETFPGVVDSEAVRARAARLQQGLATLWLPELGWYCSRDLVANTPIKVRVSAGLLPMLTDAPSPEQVASLAGKLEAMLGGSMLPVPSTLPDQPGYDPKRYWRGPVWAIVNWMIARGFARHGHAGLALRLDAATREAIDRQGFCEYFDPGTRKGLGGGAFSWTAAIRLLLDEGGAQG